MSKLPDNFEEALTVIASNPSITKDEARRVLKALSEIASKGEISSEFSKIVLGGKVTPDGNNACIK